MKKCAFIIFFFSFFFMQSQNITLPLNNSFSNHLEQHIYCTNSFSHTSVKPYLASNLKEIISLEDIQVDSVKNTFSNRTLSWFWNALFNRHFVEVKKDTYSFFVDPLVDFQFGRDFSNQKSTYTNTRGFQIGGNIGSTFSFYTTFEESQAIFPKYIGDEIDSTLVIPGTGLGYIKRDGHVSDFSYAEAYISYTPSKYFNFRFGQFKNFWGDGYRSLFLSDNSAPYPQLLITTHFWKIKYVNLYAQMGDIWGANYENAYLGTGYNKKMVSAQYLSWDVTSRWNLNFFETVVFKTYDTNGNYKGINWGYLNPVIFLRPVEFQHGSPDNMMIGMGTSVRIGKQNILYSQLVLGEFVLDEIKNWSNGWWGNKSALQIGAKLFNLFGIENLYFQTEYNAARPYMYSDKESSRSWGQYNQPLAHPTGANFQEALAIVKYRYKRFFFEYKVNYITYGADTNGSDWGKNVFLPYNQREMEYGNFTGQGLRTTVLYNDFKTSWLINPTYNFNIFAGVLFRNCRNNISTENTKFVYFGIATSIRNRYYDF